uniref:Secreted protein n=1 Tax=Physcomitrium patens TaxID=3218 RepID=A0A2K1INF6_PHYPA|nr:hypothetical protein PHYPA_027129 [Physcomitrium patens]
MGAFYFVLFRLFFSRSQDLLVWQRWRNLKGRGNEIRKSQGWTTASSKKKVGVFKVTEKLDPGRRSVEGGGGQLHRVNYVPRRCNNGVILWVGIRRMEFL